MKYLLFTLAVIGVVPLTAFLMNDRRLIRWSVLGMILPLAAFNSLAINFFSHELYRGTSRGMEVSIIYIVALTLLFVLVLLRGWKKLLPEFGCWLYLFYFLLSLPSMLNAPNLLYSFFEVWKMIMVYLVFLAVYYYLEFSEGDLDIILYGVSALVAINFFVMLSEHFHSVYRPHGIFPHQNSMAMFMMIAGLLYFARFLNHQDRRIMSVVFFTTFLLASFAVVRSYSRGAIFCYPLGGLITLICSIRGGLTIPKMRKIVILVPLIVIGLVIFTPKVIKRFQTAPESSADTRKNLAKAALRMVSDRPYIGVGLNNWGVVINYTAYSGHRDWNKGQTDEFQDGIVETIYLLVAAECGIPCLLLLLGWFGYYWVTSFALVKKLQLTKYYFFAAGACGALTAIFMQSALEWVLKQQMNLIWLVMVFAVLSFLNKHHKYLKARDLAPDTEHEPADTAGDSPDQPAPTES